MTLHAARAVVLLSGGLDSAVAMACARDEGFRCYALTVRYGQRHEHEVGCAASVARSLSAAEHRIIDLDLASLGGSALFRGGGDLPPAGAASGIPPTYVPARNTVLLSIALAWAEALDAQAIYLGINAVDYSGYPDCRPEYLEAFRRLAGLATKAGVEGRAPEVRAPLLNLSKEAIVRRGAELGLDFSLTSSCYDPAEDGTPCGRCDSCGIRAQGFLAAGILDPRMAGGGR